MTINPDLVGGLKSALERGATLKQAMMSLFNSGYKREEIEEAARNLNSFSAVGIVQPQKESSVKPLPQTNIEVEKPIKKLFGKPLEKTQYPQLQVAPQTQKVSNYEKPENDKATITALIVILVFLLLTLGVILIFKNELINFFNTMLS
jgi:hypothetical protein